MLGYALNRLRAIRTSIGFGIETPHVFERPELGGELEAWVLVWEEIRSISLRIRYEIVEDGSG